MSLVTWLSPVAKKMSADLPHKVATFLSFVYVWGGREGRARELGRKREGQERMPNYFI